MGPKRKLPETNGVTKDQKRENNQEADHELFLQAFEKPTQIYRYLRTRSVVLPIFLPRTLSYMKQRRSVSNSKRKTFQVDSILSGVQSISDRSQSKHKVRHELLRLTFSGFHIAEFATEAEYADVEVQLLRICQKKRKDSPVPIVPVSLKKIKVPVNPKAKGVYKMETLEIPSSTFTYQNGHVVRSHVLAFHVNCATLKEAENSTTAAVGGGEGFSPCEPPIKRRRNGRISTLEEETLSLSRELVVYDKSRTCLLCPGEYELGVEAADGSEKKKLLKTWESFSGKNVGPLELLTDYPTLKFTLDWVDHNNCVKKADPDEAGVNHTSSRIPHPRCDLNNTSDFLLAFGAKSEYQNPKTRDKGQHNHQQQQQMSTTPRKRLRVFYQFTHNNSTQQETEARDDLRCPWCSLSCIQLYSLLKHLRLCHGRFNFLYIPHPKGARIDVSINERYDGSYVGNPQDIHSHVGYAFSRSSPMRRTPITHVLVYRPKRPPPSLAEFQELESDTGFTRQLVQGHNRLYFHTITCQPVRPQELDNEGKEETPPHWLKEKTTMMIDEFTDVNEGEKELMKMWNLHIMEKEYIGDVMVPRACVTFVEDYGRKLVEKDLCLNFLLHLVNLYDFGLLRPDMVERTYAMLENLHHYILQSRTNGSHDML